MSGQGPVEIGWRKELLEGAGEDKGAAAARSRSPIKKKHYHRLSTDDDSSSSSSSSSSGSDNDKKKKREERKERRERRKEEKKLKKERRKLEKAQHREMKKAKKEKRREEKKLKKLAKKSKDSSSGDGADCSIPIDLMFKSHAPETREQYETRQNIIRRVVDPSTGRQRLIKGDGEILEEIVSRDRHKEINRQATRGDGDYYQSETVGWDI